MRKGILIGGNWIIDQVKMIDVFPEEEKLVNISTESSSNGGSAYNIVMALIKLKADFPLCGLGLVGDDARGEEIINGCAALGVDTAQIRKAAGAFTSYTDVMTVQGTGKRTFFHQRGANALLDMEHFDFSSAREKIFHLGYLLLLDKLDQLETDGMTRAAKVFKQAKENGYLTSADIVSERSTRFHKIIPPSLPYIDYLFVNEFEAGMITGIKTTDDGKVNRSGCMEAASGILEMGVQKWVFLHFPEGVIALSKDGHQLFQPSIQLPAEKIGGAVGAGDAFAAGVLMGIHENWEMERCLILGVCAAASSLFERTSSDGILPADDCLALTEIHGFRKH